MVEEIDRSNFSILNQDSYTRLPGNNQRATSPDISLVSAHLALAVSWDVNIKLSSDHLPISISFVDDHPNPRLSRSFINFGRADWNGYRDKLERLVSQLPQPTSCAAGEKDLRKAIQTAGKHHIPAGFIKHHLPCKNREIQELEKSYDDLRSRNPDDPELGNLAREIRMARNKVSRDKWRDFIESLDRKKNSKNYWRVMKNLSGKRSFVPPNQPIKFNGRFYTKHGAIARRFNTQYTNVRKHSSSKDSRKIKRKIQEQHQLDPNFRPFSAEDTAEAIKSAKNSTALGPDDLSTVHFKHMGPLAIGFLTSLFNLSVSNADLPAIWKRSIVLPVLKPNKSADEGVSYRPISLLCPASKILEKLIHPYLKELFTFDDSQHGF